MRLAQQMGVGACWTVGTCVPVHWLHHPTFITLCPTTAAQIYHNLLHDLHRNHHSIQHVFFSMALHALLAINVATWKNPPLPSTIIWMHVERICVQRQAVTKKTFHPIQRKKNHRNKAAEVTRTPACRKDVMARADQQVSCVIFSEIIHSLDDYFSIHVKTSPTANNMTGRNSVLPIIIILILIPEIFMCATVSVRTSWQVSAASAETWKWPLLAHSYPS